MDSDCRVYVSCLASYVAGHLHGEWIDLNPGVTEAEVWAEIEDILESSPIPNAEEWAIHDEEFPYGVNLDSEYPGVETIVRVANAIHQHGEVFAVAMENLHDIDTAISDLDNGYRVYESSDHFAEEVVENDFLMLGAYKRYGDKQLTLDDLPSSIRHNINLDGVYQDQGYSRTLLEMSDGRILEMV